MNATQYKEAVDFDQNLKVGQAGVVHWTNCGNHYAAPGIVTKLNPKSVRVKLSAAIGEYPLGQIITVPRISNWSGWTANNSFWKN
jgi:hypothetical protein